LGSCSPADLVPWVVTWGIIYKRIWQRPHPNPPNWRVYIEPVVWQKEF
jgi:hypothetical protein